MKYHIDPHLNIPAYMQLYHQLRRDIVSGAFAYGSRLPSKRLLAEESSVSVITVQRCYSILSDEGYIEARERSGYFVIYREKDFFARSYLSDDEAKPFHPSGENQAVLPYNGSEFPFSVLAKTMRKVMLDYSGRLLVKSPNHGCPELRQAISGYLARAMGIDAGPEQIIIGSGAEYLYTLLAQLFGNNCIFGLENPSYSKIAQVYAASGIECDMLRMDSSGIMSSELARTQAGVLHITPFNSFPSGITADVSKRQEYLRWAEARSGFIIEDNYESELTVSRKNDDTVFSLSKTDSVIFLNTFSATVAPSMRVGYMVLPLRLLDEFESRLGFYSCTVPVFEQYVLSELIQSGDFERHINRVRRSRRREGR